MTCTIFLIVAAFSWLALYTLVLFYYRRMDKEQRIASILLLIALAILLLAFSHDHFSSTSEPPEVVYVPQQDIVNEIVVSETIAVPIHTFPSILESSFSDEELDLINKRLDALRLSIVAFNVTRASGSSVVIEREVLTENCSLTPVSDELTVQFEDVYVPVASVELNSTGMLRSSSYPIDIQIDTIVNEGVDSGISVINALTLISNGQPYRIPIESTTYYLLEPSITKIEEPPSFRWWDPALHLDLQLDTRLSPMAGLSFSFLNFRENNRFLKLGAFMGSEFALNAVPWSYNLGSKIPLIRDLWVGPGVNFFPMSNDWSYSIVLGTIF